MLLYILCILREQHGINGSGRVWQLCQLYSENKVSIGVYGYAAVEYCRQFYLPDRQASIIVAFSVYQWLNNYYWSDITLLPYQQTFELLWHLQNSNSILRHNCLLASTMHPKLWAVDLERHFCSDFRHVTVPYKLLYYYFIAHWYFIPRGSEINKV